MTRLTYESAGRVLETMAADNFAPVISYDPAAGQWSWALADVSSASLGIVPGSYVEAVEQMACQAFRRVNQPPAPADPVPVDPAPVGQGKGLKAVKKAAAPAAPAAPAVARPDKSRMVATLGPEWA